MTKKPASKNVYYDNTMLSSYKECPRMFYLRHIRGWRKEGTSPPLAFGLAWHEAMDVVWQHIGKSRDVLIEAAMKAWNNKWVEEGMPGVDAWSFEHEEKYSPRTPSTAKRMLLDYIEARLPMLQKMKLIAAEQPFAVPIFPDQPHIWYIGRLDKKVEMNGSVLGIEHKTTTEYKKDGGFKTQYLEGWSPNSQVEGYLFQSQSEDRPLRHVWIDAALVHKTVSAFKFLPIAASTAGLDAWLWEARDWISRVLSEDKRLAEQPKNAAVLSAFPRNTNACSGKYGLCGYINICRHIPNPHNVKSPPPEFIEDRWMPFDVLGLEKIMKR